MASRITSFLLVIISASVLFAFVYHVILNQTWRQFENDLSITYFFLCLLIAFHFCLPHTTTFLRYLICKICRLYFIYGPVRLCIYAIFVCLFSYVFVVVILDGSVMFTWNLTKVVLISRFQENVFNVEDPRQTFGNVSVHSLTEGKTSQTFLYDIYRYREEDAKFTCEREFVWFPGGRQYVQQVVWKRNGKPLAWSARFREELVIREQKKDESHLTRVAAMHYLSIYKITSTLKIYLLKSYDFGNYTCHITEKVRPTLEEWVTNVNNKIKERKAVHDCITFASFKEHTEHKKINKLAAIASVGDRYTPSYVFRLIEVPPRKIIIHAPPGAVLAFRTSYWHLSESNEDVSAEYFINEESTEIKRCQGAFSGCSMFLWLYWFFNFHYSLSPPFLQSYTIAAFPDQATIPEHVHCLCKISYGHHNVYFSRRFYNYRKKQYELIEVRHPNDLVVLPREQDMLYMFQNISSREKQAETKCPAAADMRYVEMAAEAFASQFGLWENVIAWVGVAVCLLILVVCLTSVRAVGAFGGKMIFDMQEQLVEQRHVDNHQEELDDAQKNFANNHFDFFVSCSHPDAGLVVDQILPVLRNIGLKVCIPDRDIPLNLHLLSAVSTAIDNSDRFIILLSSEYLKDRFTKNMEADMIGDKASDSDLSPRTSLLVIKLDDCQLLPWMTSFEVHDWTTFLPREDQLRRFRRWVNLCINRNIKNECYRICLTFLPFLLLFVAYLIVSKVLRYSNVSLLDVVYIMASAARTLNTE